MEINNSVIDSMVELLETVANRKVDLPNEIKDNPDFSNYLKDKAKVEMGGHIPQLNSLSDVDYCIKPDFASKVIKSF